MGEPQLDGLSRRLTPFKSRGSSGSNPYVICLPSGARRRRHDPRGPAHQTPPAGEGLGVEEGACSDRAPCSSQRAWAAGQRPAFEPPGAIGTHLHGLILATRDELGLRGEESLERMVIGQELLGRGLRLDLGGAHGEGDEQRSEDEDGEHAGGHALDDEVEREDVLEETHVERLGRGHRLGPARLGDRGRCRGRRAAAHVLAAAELRGMAQPPIARRAWWCAAAARAAGWRLGLEMVVVDDDGGAQEGHDENVVDDDHRCREDAEHLERRDGRRNRRGYEGARRGERGDEHGGACTPVDPTHALGQARIHLGAQVEGLLVRVHEDEDWRGAPDRAVSAPREGRRTMDE